MKLSIVCLSTIFFLYNPLLQAETKIYQWVDADGSTHFSDTAVPGTQQITVGNKNLVSSDVLKPNSPSKSKTSTPKQEDVITYQAEIISPQDDMAIRSNDGTLEVHVKTTPDKESSQLLQLILDGQPLGAPQISPTIRALNIDRGTHQVQVHLLDENGDVLAKTQIVTVYLQRAAL